MLLRMMTAHRSIYYNPRTHVWHIAITRVVHFHATGLKPDFTKYCNASGGCVGSRNFALEQHRVMAKNKDDERHVFHVGFNKQLLIRARVGNVSAWWPQCPNLALPEPEGSHRLSFGVLA